MYFGLIKYVHSLAYKCISLYLFISFYLYSDIHLLAFALIQKPIETFYENCLSFVFACQHLIQYWCCTCWMPFSVSSRFIQSRHLFAIITLVNKNCLGSWKAFSFIVSIVFDSINLMRFVLCFFSFLYNFISHSSLSFIFFFSMDPLTKAAHSLPLFNHILKLNYSY